MTSDLQKAIPAIDVRPTKGTATDVQRIRLNTDSSSLERKNVFTKNQRFEQIPNVTYVNTYVPIPQLGGFAQHEFKGASVVQNCLELGSSRDLNGHHLAGVNNIEKLFAAPDRISAAILRKCMSIENVKPPNFQHLTSAELRTFSKKVPLQFDAYCVKVI